MFPSYANKLSILLVNVHFVQLLCVDIQCTLGVLSVCAQHDNMDVLGKHDVSWYDEACITISATYKPMALIFLLSTGNCGVLIQRYASFESKVTVSVCWLFNCVDIITFRINMFFKITAARLCPWWLLSVRH